MMIIYFSATGNNKYIANQISEKINDKAVSMIELTRKKEYEINMEDNEPLAFIIPTYFLGLPKYVEEFLSKTTIKLADNNYIFIISSYGTSPGYSTGYIKEYLEEQNIKTHAEYSIKMPDTWTPIFDLSNPEKVDKQTRKVETQLKNILANIKDKREGRFIQRKTPKLIANISQMYYDYQRKTSHLNVNDKCNTCQLCVKSCPINAIVLEDNKISWQTERCVMCLRCLHRCPQFAIQYDNKTLKHGQYTNPHIKTFD